MTWMQLGWMRLRWPIRRGLRGSLDVPLSSVCAAVAPGDPGERQRLAVVVKQPRDADLRHPAAMR